MSRSSDQVAMSAEELDGLAKKLNEMVGKFRV
jgi:methyl-accepting chemotaxis protein